ncbi:ferrous iron transport protein A [Uruburuella suis]|jgi:ferrous iron transport protein A|uniref:Ferrous iron transport protein A n=1 Tax=Uruburuella suis TaxID=252130 RepID=A0AAE9KJB6_9NEIS|nr:FeoA family protein [Uruburuella suis]TCP04869.1 ferrous iron transport protein A [Uruburuella suis]UOO80358.1 ferrous iron transport protein A [Uruburuella suis]
MATLQDLRPNDRARISGFAETGRAYRKKLLSMGLTPGAELTVKRIAPMGDPVEISVRGFSLSLRKAEADALLVEKLS